jgi:transcriptional regulator with XRE-family HTH domain
MIKQQLREAVDRWVVAGHTLNYLADLSGVPQGALWQFYRNGSGLTLTTLEKLAAVLHLSLVQTDTPQVPQMRTGRRPRIPNPPLADDE